MSSQHLGKQAVTSKRRLPTLCPMTEMHSWAVIAAACYLLGSARVYGHERLVVPEGADWTTRHMIEEHHITSFDAASFFHLHDFDGNDDWTVSEIMKTYGFEHESTQHISQAQKEAAARQVVSMYDRDTSGSISYAEFLIGDAQDIKLPDFGWGPGHHGDDEYEFEIHHWEIYHADSDVFDESELTHPEDIEHFRKHEMLEDARERQEQLDRMPIVEANIPAKFRRDS